MIVVIASSTIKEERKDDYIKLAEKMVAETRKEDGCISYECCQKNVFPHEFTMVEKWESQTHLNAHFETAHFKEFVAKKADLVDEKGPIDIYNVLI